MSQEGRCEEQGGFNLPFLNEQLQTIAMVKIIWRSVILEEIIWLKRLASLQEELRRLSRESQSH